MSFMEISFVTVVFFLKVSVNCYPYFPFILTNLGDIQYKKYLHDTVVQVQVSWKIGAVKPYFTEGSK